MLWTVTGGDTDTTDHVYTLLTGLYQDGQQTELLEVLRVLYGVLGLAFPDDVELLAGHPEVRSYFLFSFLLDYDDIMGDYMAGQQGKEATAKGKKPRQKQHGPQVRRGLCHQAGQQRDAAEIPCLFQGKGRGRPYRRLYRLHGKARKAEKQAVRSGPALQV